jgi:hypothetical protein
LPVTIKLTHYRRGRSVDCVVQDLRPPGRARHCYSGRTPRLRDARYRLGAVVALYRMREARCRFRRDRGAAVKMLVTKKPPALGRGFSWDALTTINAPWRLMPELSLRKPGLRFRTILPVRVTQRRRGSCRLSVKRVYYNGCDDTRWSAATRSAGANFVRLGAQFAQLKFLA